MLVSESMARSNLAGLVIGLDGSLIFPGSALGGPKRASWALLVGLIPRGRVMRSWDRGGKR